MKGSRFPTLGVSGGGGVWRLAEPEKGSKRKGTKTSEDHKLAAHDKLPYCRELRWKWKSRIRSKQCENCANCVWSLWHWQWLLLPPIIRSEPGSSTPANRSWLLIRLHSKR